MVPPSSDYKYPQAWDCVSPSNGKFTQDRDHLPITLHTPGVTQVPGSFPPPMAPPTLLPHRPLRLGVEDGRQRPSNSCLTLGWGPADPSQESEIRKAVCFSFQEEQASRAFPNNHEPDPSEDQQGLSSSDQLAAWPALERGTGLGPGTLQLRELPGPGPSRAQGQAGRSQSWDLPGRATREGLPNSRSGQPGFLRAIWSQSQCMCLEGVGGRGESPGPRGWLGAAGL